MNEQPEALWLADALDSAPYSSGCTNEAADELRRLHAVNAELLGLLKALMDTRHKHFINNEVDGMRGWDEQVQDAINALR
jgi:DNA-binding FrmR family transcriptional regulator